MSELLTPTEMRDFEQAAIAAGRATGLALMAAAGGGIVSAILDRWEDLATAPARAVVLAGPGNNGGDGFVVARRLRARGWQVAVHLLGDEATLPEDAAAMARSWREAGGVVLPLETARLSAPEPDLVVDALFGGGLTRPIPDAALAAAAALPPRGERHARVVAVDAPSGLCLASGRALGGRVLLEADLTVTFHRARTGHYLADGPRLCGDLATVHIGLEDAPPGTVCLVGEPAEAALAKTHGHKYDHGHALVLAGGVAKGGAARLAARAALRAGAGLVTLCPPPAALMENAARLDAVMLAPVADAQPLAAILEDARVNALALGPGLGLDRARALSPAALAARRATVLDADALTIAADDRDAYLGALHPACVLTPHQGEFGRVFPDIAERLRAPAVRGPAFSKVDATREAAARAGCVVLFKGPDTVIADPSGRASINAAQYGRAAPWLATAGAGDVLAGLIAGLMARGLAPMPAAETGAWLHVEAARHVGPGLVAEDLPEAIPAVFRALLA